MCQNKIVLFLILKMILQEDWTSIDALLNKEGRAPHLFMPISSGDFVNETPLMLCVWKQEEVLVKLILTARECCINALNDRGQTALGIVTIYPITNSPSHLRINSYLRFRPPASSTHTQKGLFGRYSKLPLPPEDITFFYSKNP
jgi:hypothetical protein